MSKVCIIPAPFVSSFTFIHVFIVTRCSTLEALGMPPICMFVQAPIIFGFMCLVTSASHSFASQYLVCMYRIMFRSRALPFFLSRLPWAIRACHTLTFFFKCNHRSGNLRFICIETRKKVLWRSEHSWLPHFHMQKISVAPYGQKKIVFKFGFIIF